MRPAARAVIYYSYLISSLSTAHVICKKSCRLLQNAGDELLRNIACVHVESRATAPRSDTQNSLIMWPRYTAWANVVCSVLLHWSVKLCLSDAVNVVAEAVLWWVSGPTRHPQSAAYTAR